MSRRVLVVDDDADILSLVETVLSDEGYEVLTARNGSDALERVRRQAPNLILVDLAMPVMDGRALIGALRENQLAPSTPIVVMSASPQADQGKPLGVAGRLNKPFDLDDLVACAACHLRAEVPPDGDPAPASSAYR